MEQPAFAAEVERRIRTSAALARSLVASEPDARPALRGELQREAHTLRGAALVLGLEEAAVLASELDELARSDRLPDPEALGRRVRAALASVPAHRGEGGPAAASAGPGRRILCVDDSEPNLLLLARFLERRGDAFAPARTGEEALERAWADRPDAVLLDLELPDLGGLEVLAALRADARTREVPVVVVSADARAERIAEAQACGARDYLVKPLDLARLGAVLDALA